jgi:hypothetical protein
MIRLQSGKRTVNGHGGGFRGRLWFLCRLVTVTFIRC